MNKTIKSIKGNLRTGALLTFFGINLRFATGNLIKALILFNILKSGNPERNYELHVPNIPDIIGDAITIITFVFAYLLIISVPKKDTFKNYSEINGKPMKSDGHLIQYTKDFFVVTIIGYSLYFLSKYFLTTGLEVFLENDEGSILSSILNCTNSIIKICSALIIVHAYCRYTCPHKVITVLLYTFFLIRNLFVTNLLGFITQYDLYPCAPLLDIFSPIIIIYSIVSIIIPF